jgi:hypothetical protein
MATYTTNGGIKKIATGDESGHGVRQQIQTLISLTGFL